jgi:hypothetical protein
MRKRRTAVQERVVPTHEPPTRHEIQASLWLGVELRKQAF